MTTGWIVKGKVKEVKVGLEMPPGSVVNTKPAAGPVPVTEKGELVPDKYPLADAVKV